LNKSIFSAVWAKQSLTLLKHEFRRGELTIVFLAIVLAVATVFSLSGFSAHIQQALVTNSTSFIAADRVLRSSHPIEAEIIDKSNSLLLKNSTQIQMESMAFAGDDMQLVSIKAIDQHYPLRGELLIQKTRQNSESFAMNAPELGNIWLADDIFKKLNISIGDKIDLGLATFNITGVIAKVPDASFSVFSRSPQVIINLADLEKTTLVQPASRVTYKYLFAGSDQEIDQFSEWIKPFINDTQRWYDIKSRQSPLASALNRAEKYFSLASMLGIILAAVAIAVASRRYSQRHQPTVAVFKALGASTGHIQKLYCLHWSLLSLISIVVGLVVGFVLLQWGISAAEKAFTLENDNKDVLAGILYPLSVAIITGLICALAFAVTPMKQLINTSPLKVIRGFDASENKGHYSQQLLPIFALYSLLILFSRDFILSFALLLGGVVISFVLVLLGKLIMNAGRTVGSKAGSSWHLAMANLKKRASENSVQLISFTIAIKLLLIILVMKNSLINEWQQQLPNDAPNRFLVNISPEQVSPLEAFIQKHQVVTSGLHPMVMGRLVSVNKEKVAQKVTKEEDDSSDQGRQGAGRELGLTWSTQLPDNNVITEGAWWQPNDQQPQVSIASTVAERLDIAIDDTVEFTIGSEAFSAKVTSLRDVDWQSMQPNFVMIFNEVVLKGQAVTYISGLLVPEVSKLTLQNFLNQYPTITVIDVDAEITQFRLVIEQVSVAIEFILILVILAGSLVLVAQVQASMEERERELAILRTLGAKGSLLRNSVLFEFIALGAIAGFMASLAMEVAVYLLQSQVFDMSFSFHYQYWAVGILSGAIFVGFIGLMSCWRLLNLSSVTLIRRTM
jgi:putative ABC transport system permease protein